MSPYLESEVFPRGRRLLLVPLALVFLIGPYGSMLGGGPSDPVRWAVTMVCIAICTAILALGLAPPRRRIVVDGEAGTIRISSTPPPPHFGQVHEERAIADVTGVEIEIGTRNEPTHRVVVRFRDAPPLYLRANPDRDRAQDTVDRLVLQGLPGHSRADERARMLDAPNPTTWL